MSELCEALRAWVRDVETAFGDDPPGRTIRDVGGSERWVPRQKHWVRIDSRPVDWDPRFIVEAQSFESFEAVRAAAETDPVACRHLGRLVGTSSWCARVDLHSLAAAVLPLLVSRRGQPVIDEDVSFDKRWTELDRFLRAETVESFVVWPLAGVVVETCPLELGDGVELDAANPAEIDLALRHGLLPLMFPDAEVVHVAESERYCLRRRFVVEKVIVDELRPPTPTELVAEGDALADVAEDFADALSLVGPGRSAVLGQLEEQTIAPFGAHGMRWSKFMGAATPRQHNSHVMVGTHEAGLLLRLWRCVRTPGFRERHLGLSLALRRFAASALRKGEDDQIIDLLIAAEALYLADAGNTKDRGELRYRLALRGAYWSDPDALRMSRRDVYELLRVAYDVRSTVVHGGSLDGRSVKLKGEKVSVGELIEATRDVLRQGLAAAVLATEAGARWAPDWDGEILTLLDQK